VAEEAQEVDLWRIVKSVKTRDDFRRLFRRATFRYQMLERFLRKGPTQADAKRVTVLRGFGARMFALGAIRGMQFGRQIEIDSKRATIANSIFLKYDSVAKLLVKEPKATNREICLALDRLKARMPWSELKRQNLTWEECKNNPTVKMAIMNARKAALQAAAYREFVAQLDAIGNEGSVFSKYQFKNRRLKNDR
jgi:hypothetical protein